MTTIISESPDRKSRIIIDRESETVTFIGCHLPRALWSSYTQAEFVCPFEDILKVHDALGRPDGRASRVQIVTTDGHAFIRGNWANFDETRNVLREISKSTPNVPMLRNFNVSERLVGLVAVIIVVILIVVYFWLTGN